MFGLSRTERWAKIRENPFPPGWSAILEKDVPIYERLSEVDRAELRGLIQIFLAEKVFEGCGGLEITDEIKLTIAAQACLLLLRRETEVYPRLITILVYPSAYVSNMPRHSPQGIVTEGPQGLLGEAWTSGVVVLSWDDVKQGAADVRDGHNVVFHEFAHQLDQEDGTSDGAPILPRRNLYSAWARVLGEEYDELRKVDETGKKSVLDTYGATNPAEFFAVATEAFFEKPVQLKKKHPELYEELKIYYAQDPEADFGVILSRPNPAHPDRISDWG
jgi:Mlc titration factor MtfA (ptsG expression regulator)